MPVGRGRKQKGKSKGSPTNCSEEVPDDEDSGTATAEKGEEAAVGREAPSSPHSEDETQTQQGKKKRPKTLTHLTREQEELMVQWLQSNEILYNKKLESYKDTKKKGYLWQQQAMLLGKTVEELQTWYTSLRTRFTKLNKKKSGDGAVEPSERDEWVLANFAFLAPFTYEVKKRTLVSVKSKLLSGNTPQSSAGETQDHRVIPPAIPPDSAAHQSTDVITKSPSTSDSRPLTPAECFASTVTNKMDQFFDMQNNLMQQMIRPNRDRKKDAFIEYVRESIYDMHPTVWEELHRDIMRTVLMFKDKDADFKRKMEAPTTEPLTSHSFASSSHSSLTSASWQPPPYTWPSQVQKPVSVWGSMDAGWVSQQQFSQQQRPPNQFSQHQQPQQISHQQPQQQPPQQQDRIPSPLAPSTPVPPCTISPQNESMAWTSGLSTYLREVDNDTGDGQRGDPDQN